MDDTQPNHGSLTLVPDPPPFDEEAEVRAAWNEVAAGYERALERLSPDHPARQRMVESHRDACFLAHRDPLTRLVEKHPVELARRAVREAALGEGEAWRNIMLRFADSLPLR